MHHCGAPVFRYSSRLRRNHFSVVTCRMVALIAEPDAPFEAEALETAQWSVRLPNFAGWNPLSER